MTECAHPQLRSVKYVLANGLWQHRRQCIECGKLLPGSLPKKSIPEDAQSVTVAEEQLRRDKEFEDTIDTLRRLRENARNAERNAWLREHDEYLTTPEWRLKRKAVLDRCHNLCEGCGVQSAMQVHHLTYRHWKNEFLFELVGLCKACHERVHED